MSLPLWQSRRTKWGGGGGIWVKCARLLAIATLGLKSCTDLKCVRCCTVLYDTVPRRIMPPTKLKAQHGHWANDSPKP